MPRRARGSKGQTLSTSILWLWDRWERRVMIIYKLWDHPHSEPPWIKNLVFKVFFGGGIFPYVCFNLLKVPLKWPQTFQGLGFWLPRASSDHCSRASGSMYFNQIYLLMIEFCCQHIHIIFPKYSCRSKSMKWSSTWKLATKRSMRTLHISCDLQKTNWQLLCRCDVFFGVCKCFTHPEIWYHLPPKPFPHRTIVATLKLMIPMGLKMEPGLQLLTILSFLNILLPP